MASTGVVAVLTNAKTAENTAKSMARQTDPIVVTHNPYFMKLLSSFSISTTKRAENHKSGQIMSNHHSH